MGQTLKRFEDWPERLFEYLSRDHRFDWEKNNCAFFASDAVLAMTGVDLSEKYRGPKTQEGIYEKMESFGFSSLSEAVTAELGESLSSMKMAKRGDFVLCNFPNGEALGVCIGSKAAFLFEGKGLVFIPSKMWTKFWRV